MSARLVPVLTAATLAACLLATAHAEDPYPPKDGAPLQQTPKPPPVELYPGAIVWPEVGPWIVGYPKDYPEDEQSLYGMQPGSGHARIGVFVPDGAEVWVGGEEPAAQSAPRLRDYITPKLTPGPDYHYEVRACWRQKGRTVDQTRTVAVHANGWVSVDFTRPER